MATYLTSVFLHWFKLRAHLLVTFLAQVFLALVLWGCAGTDLHPRYINTCDLSDARSGAPHCLPPPAFFCIPAEEAAKQATKEVECQKSDPRFVGQCFTVLPSRQSLGPNLPICPPNGTRLTQEQDWKDAKKGATFAPDRWG